MKVDMMILRWHPKKDASLTQSHLTCGHAAAVAATAQPAPAPLHDWLPAGVDDVSPQTDRYHGLSSVAVSPSDRRPHQARVGRTAAGRPVLCNRRGYSVPHRTHADRSPETTCPPPRPVSPRDGSEVGKRARRVQKPREGGAGHGGGGGGNGEAYW